MHIVTERVFGRGGLTRAQLRQTLHRHMNEVRFCYERGLMHRPAMEGFVSIQFIVGADGEVLSAQVAEASDGIGEVGACIAHSVRRWVFPSDDGPTLVTYPIALRSISS